MEKTVTQEIINPGKVLPICAAGVNRSGIIRDVLRERGYDVLENRGVNNNVVSAEDIQKADTIIFASGHEREWFEKNLGLSEAVTSKGVKILELNVTQSDQDKSRREKDEAGLRKKIEDQLDLIGLKLASPQASPVSSF